MATGLYKGPDRKEPALRDQLAIDRTLLANERTMLAYLRSAAALLIAGLTIIQFAKARWFVVFGIACLPGALIVAALGVRRYRRMNHEIMAARRGIEESARGANEPGSPGV